MENNRIYNFRGRKNPKVTELAVALANAAAEQGASLEELKAATDVLLECFEIAIQWSRPTLAELKERVLLSLESDEKGI